MNKRDFERVYARGRRARRDGLTVWVAPSDPGGSARLGLAVPGRAGNAVVRNRIRRRIRHAFRATGPTGIDVVVRADAEAASRNFQELTSDLGAALEAARAEAGR